MSRRVLAHGCLFRARRSDGRKARPTGKAMKRRGADADDPISSLLSEGSEKGADAKDNDLNDPVHVGLIKCSGDISDGEFEGVDHAGFWADLSAAFWAMVASSSCSSL